MKYLLSLIILICFLFLSLYVAISQEKEQEEVTVTAVEVPVRVLQKGQVVKDLTRDDFEVYENAIKQDITGFEIISRKIFIPIDEQEVESKKRVFILIFNIFDYFDEVGEAIDYFFKNHFHEGDQVFILTEDQLFYAGEERNLSKIISNLKKALKKYKQITSHNVYQAYRDLRERANNLIEILRQVVGRNYDRSWEIIKFYDYYMKVWKEYRRRYLHPDLDHYRSVIRRIKLLDGEIWVLCFQQRELFPVLKNQGQLDWEIKIYVDGLVDWRQQRWARQIESRQWQLKRSFNISDSFPYESLEKLFMEANLTFHLILLKSSRPLVSRDFELDEVHQEYEASLKDLSFVTGGVAIFSNKVSEALIEATQKEDYFYSLWYTTTKNRVLKDKDIEVKVKRAGAEVIYRKHFTPKGKPPIVITDFKARNKAIEFTLINYERREIEGNEGGVVEVKITLFDENSDKAFSEVKMMSLPKVDAHFSIGFPKLESGNYFIIIEATDKILNEKSVFSREIKL